MRLVAAGRGEYWRSQRGIANLETPWNQSKWDHLSYCSIGLFANLCSVWRRLNSLAKMAVTKTGWFNNRYYLTIPGAGSLTSRSVGLAPSEDPSHWRADDCLLPVPSRALFFYLLFSEVHQSHWIKALLWPHFSLITFFKTLSPNAVILWGTGVTFSTYKLKWGEGKQTQFCP